MTQSQITPDQKAKLISILSLISDLDDKIYDLLGYTHPIYDMGSNQLAELYTELTDNFNYDPNGPE